MGRRGKRALGDRRKWITDLAHVVRAGYPDRPADRPRELAAFISSCELFATALHDRHRPLEVRVWMPSPTEMGSSRWPVPRIPDVRALTLLLDLSLGHLHWFADTRSMERRTPDEKLRHYRRTWLFKSDGSARLLEAPKRELKLLQRQILHDILDHIPAHDAAHGFRPARSALTVAQHHIGQDVVLSLDLESFFTSVDVGRIYGVFRLAGYPEPVAHLLAGLCTTATPIHVLSTAPHVDGALLGGRRRLLQRLRAPHLPQGSPTSPALANLIAFGLDRRLTGLADKIGATYTRYADDLIFSGGRNLVRNGPSTIGLIEQIVRQEGFRIHERKTRVRTAAQRQLVTGRVVNKSSNVPRPDYDRLRAILHDAATRGPAHANRDLHHDFRAHLLGRMSWAGAGSDARRRKLELAFAGIEWSDVEG
jgi:retron-type reverse transcriptase